MLEWGEDWRSEYRLALARDGYALVTVRTRGVQAGGLRKKKGNTHAQVSPWQPTPPLGGLRVEWPGLIPMPRNQPLARS